MKYSLLVLGSPWSGQCADSAWRFANALLEQEHEVYRVFFYHDGVLNGSHYARPPQDEVSKTERWASLSEQHGTDLVLCIASAVKRGLLDDSEALRHGCPAPNVHPAFALSGLGQLIDASATSDRLVTFGC